MVGRVALGHGPDDGEGVEDVDDVQHRGHRQRGLHQGQSDAEELLEVPCSVHSGGLVIGRIDALEAGEHAEGDEGDGDEDAAGDLPGEVGPRGGRPVYRGADEADFHQQGVQGAVVLVDDEVPGAGLNDQGGGPGEDHDGPGHLPAPEFVVQHQGQHEAQHGGDDHHGDGPDDGVFQHQGEGGAFKDLGEVLKVVVALDQARPGHLAHGELEHLDDGGHDEDGHQDDAGGDPDVGFHLAEEFFAFGGTWGLPGQLLRRRRGGRGLCTHGDTSL